MRFVVLLPTFLMVGNQAEENQRDINQRPVIITPEMTTTLEVLIITEEMVDPNSTGLQEKGTSRRTKL